MIRLPAQIDARYPQGVTLALTVVTLGLALILGLTLSGASVTFLHQSGSTVKKVKAQVAAEACLAEIASQVVADGEFGVLGKPEDTIHLTFPGSEAHLSFNPEIAEGLGIPCSTSNRYGLEPEIGKNGDTVQAHSVQAFCLGRSANYDVLLECILVAPEFPYVIASSGPIQSEGALIVGSAEDVTEAQADELKATAIASNGDVRINGQAQIFGDLSAAGQIQLADSVFLRGESRPQSGYLLLEDLNIPDLRPEESIPLDSTFAPRVMGSVHHNGPNLTISGGLTMDDAVLYINGDARILGGVRGRGAIVVNGSLELEGSNSLVAEDQLALVVQEDLSITGTAQDSSFFQGLVYTEGDFYTEDVTLMGAFVANRQANSTEPGSRIQLKNTTLVHIEEYGKFDLEAANAYLIWDGNKKEHSGGRESLHLIEIDVSDAGVLNDATTVTLTTNIRAEGEASDNNGGSGSDGLIEGSVSTNNAAIARVARARKTTVENGRIVAEWEELDRDTELMALLESLHPNHDFSRVIPAGSGSGGGVAPGQGDAALKGFKAGPDSIFLSIARASFHQDLNEFLGASSRLRIVSVREL